MNPDWLFLIFPAIYVVVWSVGLSLAARLGGWSRLAREYRFRGPFDGHRQRCVSGEMTGGPFFGLPANYGFILTLGANPHGMYLAVAFPFRPGHPPLFIPWRDIDAKPERRFFSNYITFTFLPFAPLRLRVGERAARHLIDAAALADPTAADRP